MAKLKLKPEEKSKEKKGSAAVKMNLHRMNQLFFFCLLRWDGKRWGGGDLRAEVLQMARERWTKHMQETEQQRSKPPTDDEVVAWACEVSTVFLGFWRLLDVEIRLAVEPFILWEQGDFRHFLNALPAMCAIAGSGHKPKVRSRGHGVLPRVG